MATHLFRAADRAGLACGVPGQAERVIPWEAIENISAFRRPDQASEYAVIWLRVPEDMFPVEFTERDPRWTELLAGLAEHLQGVKPFARWFPPPLHPVFELNAHGIYARPG